MRKKDQPKLLGALLNYKIISSWPTQPWGLFNERFVPIMHSEAKLDLDQFFCVWKINFLSPFGTILFDGKNQLFVKIQLSTFYSSIVLTFCEKVFIESTFWTFSMILKHCAWFLISTKISSWSQSGNQISVGRDTPLSTLETWLLNFTIKTKHQPKFVFLTSVTIRAKLVTCHQVQNAKSCHLSRFQNANKFWISHTEALVLQTKFGMYSIPN